MKSRKTIYLIRHGQIRTEGKRCIGITEVPLSDWGYRQARRLGMWMARQVTKVSAPYKLYSSPIMRCLHTADTMIELSPLRRSRIEVCKNLHEVMMGEWENLSFDEIKKRYPNAYEMRGQNFWQYKVPGGESFEEAGQRSVACLKEIARVENQSEKEPIYFVVVHAGVIRAILAHLGEIDPDRIMSVPIPYGSVTKLRTGVEAGEVEFDLEYFGNEPTLIPDDEEIKRLLDSNQVPVHIRRHMKGVANVLLDIADILDPDNCIYDRELLYASAMLHDFAKLQKNHSSVGALKLRLEGYELVADLISEHESMELHQELAVKKGEKYYMSEEDLLYYADKRVREDVVVSLEERFEASLVKCRTQEARMNHMRRWNKAITIENDVFRYLKKTIDL